MNETLAPVELDEKTIQHLINGSPEPLKSLGDYLADNLDTDQWNHAEQYLLTLAAIITAKNKECERLESDLYGALYNQ